MPKTYSRQTFLKGAASLMAFAFLLGARRRQSGSCVLWNDTRTFNMLGTSTFNELGANC